MESEFTTHVVREDSDDGDEGTCNLSLKDDGCSNSTGGTASSDLFRMLMLGIYSIAKQGNRTKTFGAVPGSYPDKYCNPGDVKLAVLHLHDL